MASSMRLWRKFKTFLAMGGPDRLLVCESTAMLALARLIVLTVPFRILARWLSRAPETDCCDQLLLVRVRRAVTTAARNVPWNAVCLPQAIAAKAMLRRRGIGSVLHFGVAKHRDHSLDAHAWLDAAGIGVTGFPVGSEFTEIACFV